MKVIDIRNKSSLEKNKWYDWIEKQFKKGKSIRTEENILKNWIVIRVDNVKKIVSDYESAKKYNEKKGRKVYNNNSVKTYPLNWERLQSESLYREGMYLRKLLPIIKAKSENIINEIEKIISNYGVTVESKSYKSLIANIKDIRGHISIELWDFLVTKPYPLGKTDIPEFYELINNAIPRLFIKTTFVPKMEEDTRKWKSSGENIDGIEKLVELINKSIEYSKGGKPTGDWEVGTEGLRNINKNKSEPQSIIFDKLIWKINKAKKWLKEHGYKYGKVDETDNYYRFRQFDPTRKEKATIKFGEDTGIKAIVEYSGMRANPALKPFNQITVIGRRWFDRIYGNTYHSVEVYVDGKFLDAVPYEYGYGDQYKQTAFALLQKNGYWSDTGKNLSSGIKEDDYDFTKDTMNNREKYVFSVSDVARKKDLFTPMMRTKMNKNPYLLLLSNPNVIKLNEAKNMFIFIIEDKIEKPMYTFKRAKDIITKELKINDISEFETKLKEDYPELFMLYVKVKSKVDTFYSGYGKSENSISDLIDRNEIYIEEERDKHLMQSSGTVRSFQEIIDEWKIRYGKLVSDEEFKKQIDEVIKDFSS